MEAIILAAGLGTRLRPLTDRIPKALVPVDGVPVLERAARRLVAAGAHRLVINTHHFGERIEAYVAEHDGFGVDVRFSRETGDAPLETGGGIQQAARLMDLDAGVQELVRDSRLSLGHAKVLAGVTDILEQERLAKAERMSGEIIAPLKGIPGVQTKMITNVIGHQPFGVTVSVDPSVTGKTNEQVVEELRKGDPPIWTRVPAGREEIVLHVFGLDEGQPKIVGEAIAKVLKG